MHIDCKPLIITGTIIKIENNKLYLQLSNGKIIIGKGKNANNFKVGQTFKFWSD